MWYVLQVPHWKNCCQYWYNVKKHGYRVRFEVYMWVSRRLPSYRIWCYVFCKENARRFGLLWRRFPDHTKLCHVSASLQGIRIAPNLSLSWATSIHSTPSHLNSWISTLILLSHLLLSLQCRLSPTGFSTKTHVPHTCHISRPSYYFWFDGPNNICWGVQIIKLSIM